MLTGVIIEMSSITTVRRSVEKYNVNKTCREDFIVEASRDFKPSPPLQLVYNSQISVGQARDGPARLNLGSILETLI